MNINEVVINVEQDVERPGRRRRSRVDMEAPNVKKLLGMAIGDSFFLAGAEKKDARPLVDLGKRIEVFLDARRVELDSIYQQAGVRVWRVAESEMPTRRGADTSGSQPDLKIDKGSAGGQDDDDEIGTVRYWHHPESGCVGKCMPGEPFPDEPLVEPISEADYIRLSAEYDDL